MNGERLNVLLSAYFCEPHKGSEAGVGWNFAKNMAKFHNVYVLTKKSNKKLIEEETVKWPIEGLHFIYYEVPQNRLFNEKRLGEQAYYIIWQTLAYKQFKKAAEKVNFDLIHHLTFNQYRSPSIGFYSKKPFIMGPIGGAELVNPVFFKDLGLKSRLKERWRNMGIDRHLFGMLAKVKNNKKTFVFSCNENLNNLKQYINNKDKAVVIPAIAINLADFKPAACDNENFESKPFTIIYAGIAKDWKGLELFLRSIQSAFYQGENILVKLIGIRSDEENQKVSGWVNKYGLHANVQMIKFMPRSELITEMQQADLSVYPAFRDSGSMSVLESCALGCPVLCFNTGGQDVFPDEILLKVDIVDSSYEDNVRKFSDKLRWAYKNKAEVGLIGKRAKEFVFEYFNWEKKVVSFCDLYEDILTEF
jgi:glycosyltransferase involved in cell wall biosynthesis